MKGAVLNVKIRKSGARIDPFYRITTQAEPCHPQRWLMLTLMCDIRILTFMAYSLYCSFISVGKLAEPSGRSLSLLVSH